ncbi:deacylase, partial [Campylobacter lari]
YNTSNELTAVIAEKNSFYIQYGNRFQTRLYPEYLEFSSPFNKVTLQVDGNETVVNFGTKLQVKENFLVPRIKGARVNIIGFDHGRDESNILVSKKNMQKPYSLDMAGKIYRVEFYELREANLQQSLE